MLIQNLNNTAQAAQPVATPSNAAAQPGVAPEVPKTAAKQITEPKPSAEQVKNALDNINKVLQQSNNNLEFSVDESTKTQIFKLVDTTAGDVIRQYPTEEMLEISRAIDQVQQGLLLTKKA